MYTPTKYLEATDPGAFTDHEKLERPDHMPDHHCCPKCLGYGGWCLTLFAYRMPEGMADTAENRKLFRHFRCHCSQCNGWGWVPEADTACVHEWQEVSAAKAAELGVPHFGNCWHVYLCAKGCGRTRATDSSD